MHVQMNIGRRQAPLETILDSGALGRKLQGGKLKIMGVLPLFLKYTLSVWITIFIFAIQTF